MGAARCRVDGGALNDPLALAHGISKHFLATCALDNVSFEVRRGEVHALIADHLEAPGPERTRHACFSRSGVPSAETSRSSPVLVPAGRCVPAALRDSPDGFGGAQFGTANEWSAGFVLRPGRLAQRQGRSS